MTSKLSTLDKNAVDYVDWMPSARSSSI